VAFYPFRQGKIPRLVRCDLLLTEACSRVPIWAAQTRDYRIRSESAIVSEFAPSELAVPELAASELAPAEIARYSRHLILPEVGMEGQKRLKNAKVVVIGAGGLGSPVCLYLAAAGVGRIGIVDFDSVDLSNLQRQILHGSSDVGTAKLDSAARRISDLNPEITVDLLNMRLEADNALEALQPYDFVVDGTDNFASRYVINDACVLLKKPNIYGAIYRFEGQASIFHPPTGPCYRCLFPEPPPAESIPNCAEGGVLGVLAGLIGVIQATETIKLILGIGDSLVGRLLLYDAVAMRFDTVKVKRNADCPVCGDHPTIMSLVDAAASCPPPIAVLPELEEISAQELDLKLKKGKRFCLLDVRNPEEYELCHLKDAKLIPVNELKTRVQELDQNAEIVAYCKSGGRSRRAIEVLRAKGFKKLRHLTGGILAWAESVDPSMPRY
jgi:sulfur-carrier protein adenylyltransferase/sulfurtransferase